MLYDILPLEESQMLEGLESFEQNNNLIQSTNKVKNNKNNNN